MQGETGLGGGMKSLLSPLKLHFVLMYVLNACLCGLTCSLCTSLPCSCLMCFDINTCIVQTLSKPVHLAEQHTVVSRDSPYPPRYCCCAITEGRVWSDSTGFRVLCRNVCRPIRLQDEVFAVNEHL